MDWVDFKLVKAAVTIEALVGRYNVELKRVNRASLRGACPLPSHTSKGAPSFCVNTDKGAWSCKSDSCVAARGGKAGGNVLDLVAVMENCSVRDAALKLAEWFGIGTATNKDPHRPAPAASPAEDRTKLVAEKKREAEATETPPGTENKPLGFALKGIDHSHRFLGARGISTATAEAFGIGYFSGRGSMAGRVVIPIHDRRGELVAYAGRAVDETEPRYKFPSGFVKSIELYNLHRTAGEKIIVVVEGFFDCINVTSAGWPCVALMGSSMSAEQEALLAEHFTAAWIMLDGDEAGRNATRDIVPRLARRMFVRAVELPDGAQPDMMKAEDLNVILKK
jgi:DNA primase